MIYHNMDMYLNELYNNIFFSNKTEIDPVLKTNGKSIKIIYTKNYYINIYPINILNNNDNLYEYCGFGCCKICKKLKKNKFILCFNSIYNKEDNNIFIFCKHYNILNYLSFEYNYYINYYDYDSDDDDDDSSIFK